MRDALRRTAIGIGLLVAPVACAQAQDYPSRPVTIVAPSAPGGLYSLFARVLGSRLEQRLGKAFVVENRPGAASAVGAISVVRSAPDGYTLMVATTSTMATNVALRKNLGYDPKTDLTPIALVARVPEVLVVNAALPVRSIGDLVRLAKEKPGALTFASAGAGTTQHLGGDLLRRTLGVEMTHVPYKGALPALGDVAAGHVSMMFTPIPNALPLIDTGKLRTLGVTTLQRVEALPDVPPLADIGVPGFDTASWFMLVAPARTPREIVEKLNAEVRRITAEPDVRQEFNRQGLLPLDSPPPDELQRFVEAEIVRMGDIVRQAGAAGIE